MNWAVLFWILCSLAACAAVFCLVFLFRRLLLRLVDRRIDAYQSGLLKRQMEEVENLYRQMRGWRHDYHNHIQTMKAFLQLGRAEELETYLNQLDHDLNTVDQVLKTGNVMADAILNSKLSLAREREIRVHAKAAVPQALKLPEVDLCIVLGNLLDNAMEACLALPEPKERFIRLYIGTFKQQLYISVTNSMGGRPRREGGRYRSAKGDSHGFGLLRVDAVAQRWGGCVNRQFEEGVFATEVLLPL